MRRGAALCTALAYGAAADADAAACARGQLGLLEQCVPRAGGCPAAPPDCPLFCGGAGNADDFVRRAAPLLRQAGLCGAVVDVGANVGQELRGWLPLAICGESQVLAVEAAPSTHARLAASIEQLQKSAGYPAGTIVTWQGAATNFTGNATFWENLVRRGVRIPGKKMARFVRTWDQDRSYTSSLSRNPYTARSAQRVTVQARRLDDVARRMLRGQRVALIKVDAEGHDLSVLQGARGLLHGADAVLCEYSSHLWQSTGSQLEAAVGLLWESGFATFLVSGSGAALAVGPGSVLGRAVPGHGQTVFAVRRGSKVACGLRTWAAGAAAPSMCAGVAVRSLGCARKG